MLNYKACVERVDDKKRTLLGALGNNTLTFHKKDVFVAKEGLKGKSI